ncbi:aspartate/glutamate racemase family protein, partial [Limosilactobacillus fermentum]|nr:aspartate/glutamate racemase family protein [Limosilactobacillus fermentum]
DNGALKRALVQKAVAAVKQDPSIGALLLECSDLPPYATAIQAGVGLPVFDFITLINWLHQSLCQRPYYGFI